MTIEKGQDWGEVGPLPDDGVVVRSDAEARAVVTAARRANEEVPPLGLLGGDLCRTVGGRGDEARLRSGGGDPADRRPRVGAGRRAPPLVRRPPGRPPVVAAGPAVRRLQRRVARGVGRRPPGPPGRRAARGGRGDHVGRRPAEGPPPPADRHPPAAPGHRACAGRTPSSGTSPRATAVWLDGERLGPGQARCRSGSSLTPCGSSSRQGRWTPRRSRTGWPTRSSGGPTCCWRSPTASTSTPSSATRSTTPTTCWPACWRTRASRSNGAPPAWRPPSSARTGSGDGPTIGIFCEYDALPEIGHACGHNVIGAAGLGAGLAAATVADELGGRVVVLGSPAEEGGGGKVFLAGAAAPSTSSTRR